MRLSVLFAASFELLLFWRVDAVPAAPRYESASNSTGPSEDLPERESEWPLQEQEDEFQEKIRRKFAILDLRPKDDCPSDGAFGIRMFYCPTPNPENVLDWQCVASDQLCNGIPDCSGAEDEDPTMCMFQLANQEQLRQLKKIIVDQSEMLSNFASNPRRREAQRFDGPLNPPRPASASFPFRLSRFRDSDTA